jgi:hypothetical protein
MPLRGPTVSVPVPGRGDFTVGLTRVEQHLHSMSGMIDDVVLPMEEGSVLTGVALFRENMVLAELRTSDENPPPPLAARWRWPGCRPGICCREYRPSTRPFALAVAALG